MKKLLLLLFLGFLHQQAFSQIQHDATFASIEEIEAPADLTPDCSALLLQIKGDGMPLRGIKVLTKDQHPAYPYTSDEKGEMLIITGLEELELTLFPSSSEYLVATIRNIQLEKGKRYLLRVDLKKNEEIHHEDHPVVKKPVIYLYPLVSTALELKLEINGELTFSYPKYQNGWKCIAMPDGNIKIGEKTYPYLFWEGKLKSIDPNIQQSGFVVKSEDIVSFLEEKLKHIGLNDKEMTDFITFWAPQLEQNAYSYLHFSIGAEYEKNISKLALSVQPDAELHIHLFHAAVGKDFKVESQHLPKFQRKGFTLVEWGGGPIELSTEY